MAKKEATIQRFAGLKGIRKKSSVYIGPNNSDGLWTIWREPGDNFIDRALKGKNKYGHLVMGDKPNTYWVFDKDDEGFPVSIATFEDERGRKEKLSQFYAATGLTHAGSNFDSDEISRGTHGIGIKATNAMSKVFKVWTCNKGQWYVIEYRNAELYQDVTKCKGPPKLPHGMKATKGSIVYFEPDLSLFSKDAKMNMHDVDAWATLTSYLVPNLTIEVTTSKGKTSTYKSKGVGEYITKLVEEKKCSQFGKSFIFQDRTIDIALAFSNAESTGPNAYTNGLLNIDGGEHVKAVFAALVKSLAPYKGKLTYNPSDLRDGLIGLVNCKIAAPKFSNQRKDRLDDERAYAICYSNTLKAFEEFWKKNKALALEISKRASELRKKTNDFLADKQLIKKVKSASKGMSDKFADINSTKTPIDQRELYIVEGDSAGGTAKKARDKAFQATFAIRGKPLNVLDSNKEKINNNKEVAGILAGIGIGSDNKDAKAIRFGKIVFLADPDVDGYHINCLLLGLFWHFTPHLFDEGKIFMLKSPEYIAEFKGKNYYGMVPEEIYKQIGTKKVDVKHIKGWGELSPTEMAPIAFDHGKRQLIRILPPKSNNGKLNFEALLSGKGTYRKVLLGIIDEEDVEPAKAKSPAKKKAANSNKPVAKAKKKKVA